MSESPDPLEDDIYEASPGPSRARVAQPGTMSPSPSPAASTSSDKENRSRQSMDKGKGRAPMGPPPPSGQEQARRKRTAEPRERDSERNQRRRTVEVDEAADDSDDVYNPDQDPEERREVRRKYRDASKKLLENRAEYMMPGSTGLLDSIKEINKLSLNVKQTSEATVDSKMLAHLADLAYKKTLAVVSGDTSQGIDIEDFITRARQFMSRADGALESQQSTQARGNVEEEEDHGDALNWEHLGRHACLSYNSRPSLPGFLLGPLSLEKRARKTIVRRAAFKPSELKETQPEMLKATDVQKNENENLTALCQQILMRLRKLIEYGMEVVESQLFDDISKQEEIDLMNKYGVSQNCGLAYHMFVINPESFGQTIENIFYVSFLIRDGHVGIHFDDDEMPFLEIKNKDDEAEASNEQDGNSKKQAVMGLDMDEWEEFIELFDLKGKPSMILHREETDHSSVGGKGWYA